jgi:hypothetical protein
MARPGWATDEHVARTRAVWSRVYGRVLTDAEAEDILDGLDQLTEVFATDEHG